MELIKKLKLSLSSDLCSKVKFTRSPTPTCILYAKEGTYIFLKLNSFAVNFDLVKISNMRWGWQLVVTM